MPYCGCINDINKNENLLYYYYYLLDIIQICNIFFEYSFSIEKSSTNHHPTLPTLTTINCWNSLLRPVFKRAPYQMLCEPTPPQTI